MCGIAGIFDLRGNREPDAAVLDAMNMSQFHRGPDEGNQFIEQGVGLAHRRLSIIDLASGQQPMFSVDGNICLVYNGEIYNFPELREQLLQMGYPLRTRSDTEVIIYAWKEWGEDCVKHFRGMFAFALYDRQAQSLFLARDRLGIKPLHYSILPDQRLIFGSELKSLKAHPDFSGAIDPLAVEEYFAFGYIPDPKTIYGSVSKLKPGYTLLFRRNQTLPTQREYWDVPFGPQHSGSLLDLQEELIDRLREAVRIRMVAEVPLGAFLSGGVDSSAVVAMMSELDEDPVNTCAIGFDVKGFNETEYAEQVAKKFSTAHFQSVVKSDDFELIDILAKLYDEPYADSSAIPTYRVCELARHRVTVALSGDGGDENFAGYRRYLWHMKDERLRGLLPQGVRTTLLSPLAAIYPKADWAPRFLRAKSTLESLCLSTEEAYMHSISFVSAAQRRQLFSESQKSALQGYNAIEVFRQHVARSPTEDPLSLIQYVDMKTYLPGDILTKVDRASMAHSLEVRVPLLDHKFVEWVSGIPPRLKLKGTEGKYIFKKALETRLPRDILYRPKMGFGVPLANWFRGPLKARVRESLLEGKLIDSGLFDPSYLNKVVVDHQSGRSDYSTMIWSLLMFEAFLH